MKPLQWFHPRRMFWRIYLYGLVMLVGLVSALILSDKVMGETPGEAIVSENYKRLQTLALTGDPKLGPVLDDLKKENGAIATLYDMEGKVKVSSAQPPLEPLDEKEMGQFRGGRFWFKRPGGTAMLVPSWNDNHVVGYLLYISETPRNYYSLMGGLLALALFVMAVVALPAARLIASPLERLTSVVEEFGQGRLSARTGLQGRSEVATLGRSFDEMAARMEGLIRGQKELLANVSHELRTPLARLGVTLDLVEDGNPDELAKRLPELRRDIGELQQLVDGVMQMARLDLEVNQAGQPGPRVQRAALPLHGFLNDTAERFQRGAPECPLQLEIPEDLPSLDADAVLVRRALHNLLDNARKYSEPGSPVTLRALVDADSVRLEVEDRGIGISATDLAQLSTPFFRTDRSRARETGGLGLGLTLVRRIVEAHGGTLSFHHAAEQGTRATLTFPKPSSVQSAA
ncbi:sensor histidine kinase [Myxococcus stipitatus DSM 14675]|uniref:histidine kinase n=1 Tax=Myxococcus stipitatus (strain DSM 14675 / JCM 12634 / Mx s8) TaxID=1278073 RepID=L7U178_MYXSD|nr:HAMP domain-containing sensor histidine kinase [Myxococcus stipitatus]AGC41923.1 sensor histidine kinase [Myxococcus stipitatus DSM 14675]